LGLQAVAAVQRSGGIVAFVDAEFGFDAGYAARMGVDVGALLLARTNDGQQAFGVIEKLAASQSVDLIVIDSLAALMPPGEAMAAIGAAEPFGQSEMLASGLRRLARALVGSPACVLFLNQMRAYQGYGYEETSCGGWSLKMHAAFRADLHEATRTHPRKRLRMRVVKNQLGARGQVEFDFEGGTGVVPEAELIDRGVECGVVTRGPAGLMFDGQVLGADRSAAIERLAIHATLAAQVRTEVLLALGITQRRPMGRQEAPEVMPASSAVNG
jgi:recombination protein RecA